MEQASIIRGFVISSAREQARAKHVEKLKEQLPGLLSMEAVYPKYEKVPFLKKMQILSLKRTGTSLNEGEIGVLLSNRKIWRAILKLAKDDTEHFLILESDSCINDHAFLCSQGKKITTAYDLFFFGAWMGHMKLKRSTKTRIADRFQIGEPYVKTICSCYGYSVNRKAAKHLLQQTAKIHFPVDEFKKYITPGYLRIGGIKPELISEIPGSSTIGHNNLHPVLHSLKQQMLDIRNSIICYFS